MEEFAAYIDAYDRARSKNDTCMILDKSYNIRSILRESTACEVFLVEEQDGERFILKIARDYRRQLLCTEYELLASLQDHCFAHVTALEEQGDRTCLLREYVPGKTLAAYAEEHKLSPSDIVHWTLQACDIILSCTGRPRP